MKLLPLHFPSTGLWPVFLLRKCPAIFKQKKQMVPSIPIHIYMCVYMYIHLFFKTTISSIEYVYTVLPFSLSWSSSITAGPTSRCRDLRTLRDYQQQHSTASAHEMEMMAQATWSQWDPRWSKLWMIDLFRQKGAGLSFLGVIGVIHYFRIGNEELVHFAFLRLQVRVKCPKPAYSSI